jgi:hypothetical protein
MTERWEGEVRYIDYIPNTVRSLVPDMDGVVVAEAHVTNAAGHTLAIVMAVTAQDLKDTTTKAAAIMTATAALPGLVANAKAEAARSTESTTLLYSWDGRLIRRLLRRVL